MLDKTFEKFGELFETFENEADAFFKRVETAIEKGRIGKTIDNDGLFGDRPFWSTTKTTILKTSAPKYEYKVVELHTLHGAGLWDGDVEAGLNSLGEGGWKMIQNDGGKATFMREKIEEEVEDDE